MTDSEAGEPTVEQLWAALEDATGADHVRILISLSNGHGKRGDDQQRLSLADAALAEAQTLRDDVLAAEAWFARGRALYGAGSFAASAESHLAGVAAARAALRSSRAGYGLMLAGDSLEEGGDLGAALARYLEAEQEFAEVNEEADAGRAAFFAGRVLWRLDRNEEAMDVLARSRAAWRRVGSAAAVVEVDTLVASVLSDLGREGEAVELLRSALFVTESLPEADVASAYLLLGTALRRAGRPQEALEYLKPAAAKFAEDGRLDQVGRALREQAWACWDCDRTDEAFALLARARAHLDACGEDQDVANCDVRRAIWLHGVLDFDGAVALNSTLAASHDERIAYWALTRKADNLRVAGRAASCVAALEELGAFAEEHPGVGPSSGAGGPMWRSALHSRCLLEIGEDGEARNEAERALSLEQTDDSLEARAWAHDVLAKVGRSAMPTPEVRDAAMEADRARAIALYLAAGRHEQARDLSRAYLPGGGQSPSAATQRE